MFHKKENIVEWTQKIKHKENGKGGDMMVILYAFCGFKINLVLSFLHSIVFKTNII